MARKKETKSLDQLFREFKNPKPGTDSRAELKIRQSASDVAAAKDRGEALVCLKAFKYAGAQYAPGDSIELDPGSRLNNRLIQLGYFCTSDAYQSMELATVRKKYVQNHVEPVWQLYNNERAALDQTKAAHAAAQAAANDARVAVEQATSALDLRSAELRELLDPQVDSAQMADTIAAARAAEVDSDAEGAARREAERLAIEKRADDELARIEEINVGIRKRNREKPAFGVPDKT